ncbi:MAG: GH116 family glycosyl hydrolase [Anaerolineae bacterium]
MSAVSSPLFPPDLPERTVQSFAAPGFKQPVSGVIYTSANPTCCGVPLGGVGTGAIDLDTRGVLGWSHIFNPGSEHTEWQNWFYPRQTPVIQPLLGISAGGHTWLLNTAEVSSGQPLPWCSEPQRQVKPDGVKFWPAIQAETLPVEGVNFVRRIRYWGHYPAADLAYESDCPLTLSLRAWAPFLPGDAAASNIPAVMFEVTVANPGTQPQSARLALAFGGPEGTETPTGAFRRRIFNEKFSGCLVQAEGVEYLLGVIGQAAQFGASPANEPRGWANLAQGLPASDPNDGSCSAAVDLNLAPGTEAVVRYVLSWYAPRIQGAARTWDEGEIIPDGGFMKIGWVGDPADGKTHFYTHMYAAHFSGALDVARRMAREHEALLARIIAWQSVVYGAADLPPWLQDALVNNLALVAEDSYWFEARQPVDEVVFPQGGFGLNESPRGCPHTSCIPCDWYGNLPFVLFFPELALSSLRLFKLYQRPDGESAFALGRIATLPDLATPEYYWQVSLNGFCYVTLLDRLWQATGSLELLREFYDSAVRTTTYTMNLSDNPGQAIRMPRIGGMEWFEFGEWAGMAAHMGALRLAGLRMMQRMAEAMGDCAYADRCAGWLAEGSRALEEELWTGSYYLNFYELETGKRSDAVMAYQLDGEWTARYHGLPGVFDEQRAKTALATIRRLNGALTPQVGVPNFCQPDGRPLGAGEKVAHYGAYTFFVPELTLLAMTAIQLGERAWGLEIARRMFADLCLVQGHTWDLPNMMRGDDGKRIFGTDYYQNMILWAMPAALAGEDIAGSLQPGSFLQRILEAARG